MNNKVISSLKDLKEYIIWYAPVITVIKWKDEKNTSNLQMNVNVVNLDLVKD